MKTSDIFEAKLEKILVKDKSNNPNNIVPMLKSDLFNVLSNYMEVNKIDIDFFVENQKYYLVLKTTSKYLKEFGTLPVG